MRLTSFLTDIGRPVAYYPKLSHITGGVKETLFLCQLLYWDGKQSNKDGWIYKTQKEMFEETGLSRYEQETARRNLKRNGFIEEKRKGVPARMHYKINHDEINSAWDCFVEDSDDVQQTSMRETNKLVCGKPTNKNDGLQQTITESTTEITTEREKPSLGNKDKPKGQEKEKIGEFVRLTKEEHQKLLDLMGDHAVSKYVENLNNYIGSKGKRYKSHYYTIRNWYCRDEKENKEKKQSSPKQFNNSIYDTGFQLADGVLTPEGIIKKD